MSEVSAEQVRAFDRRVTDLLRQAAVADRSTFAAITAELRTVQGEVRDIAASGDVFAVQVRRVQERIAVLDEQLARLVAAELPAVAERGVALVDAGFDAAGLGKGRRALTVDVVQGPLATARQGIRKNLADLQARTVFELSRMTGAAPEPVDRILASIGTKLRGSPVFGAPSAFIVGQVQTATGIVLSEATAARSVEAAEAGGPRTLKRWVHSGRGGDSRPDHAAAEQQYAAGIPWDQKFQIGSYRTLRPRGAGLPGVQRMGCRCQLAPVLVQGDTT